MITDELAAGEVSSDQLAWIEELVRNDLWTAEAQFRNASVSDVSAFIAPIQMRVRRRGLWAAHLEPAHGGTGLSQVSLALIHEKLGTTPLGPLAFGLNAPDSGNTETLAVFGTPEQKLKYLEPVVAGEVYSAFCMTEPGRAGSDPTAIDTRAEFDGTSWILNGRKWFATHGSFAGFYIVMAVTDTTEAIPHRRATMFLVDRDDPGVKVVRDIETIEHPSPGEQLWGSHAEIRFDSVRLSPDRVLGDPGSGFAIAQRRLGPGRIHHCMRWIGLSNRAFELMCDYAGTRIVQGGELLSNKQTVQNWIADSWAEMHATRLMTLDAARKIDECGAKSAAREISAIKYFGAQVLHNVVDRAVQVHGARGISGDTPLEYMLRISRAARIYDGPDEVHRQSVARSVLRERGERHE